MLTAPFRKPLTSFWSGDRLTVSLDGKSKSGSAIFPLPGSWVLAKNGESRRPPPSLLEPRMGILLPCLTHPRLTVLKPLRQVDAITPRRGCRAVARSISVTISTRSPARQAASPLACSGFSAILAAALLAAECLGQRPRRHRPAGPRRTGPPPAECATPSRVRN